MPIAAVGTGPTPTVGLPTQPQDATTYAEYREALADYLPNNLSLVNELAAFGWRGNGMAPLSFTDAMLGRSIIAYMHPDVRKDGALPSAAFFTDSLGGLDADLLEEYAENYETIKESAGYSTRNGRMNLAYETARQGTSALAAAIRLDVLHDTDVATRGSSVAYGEGTIGERLVRHEVAAPSGQTSAVLQWSAMKYFVPQISDPKAREKLAISGYSSFQIREALDEISGLARTPGYSQVALATLIIREIESNQLNSGGYGSFGAPEAEPLGGTDADGELERIRTRVF